MKHLAKKIMSEPIGLLGLVVAILALLPGYWSLISNSSYEFSFQCSEFGDDSETVMVDGGVHRDFVAIRTRCDFSNLDDQTISIKRTYASASFEGSMNRSIEFPSPIEVVREKASFNILSKNSAHAVPAGETLLFDEFYIIPVDRNWAESGETCSKINYGELVSFLDMANCVPDLRPQCLQTYLKEMNFWTGAGGQTPYRSLAIRVILGNDTIARAPFRIPWYWTPFPDNSVNVSSCPNPDKTEA